MPCFDLCGLDNFKICPMSENRDKRKLPLNRYREFFSQPKSIKIYVPNNDSYKNDITDDDDFVGRTTLMNKLYDWLTDDKYGKGSYLVTGYRGMGKTSMVKRVLNRITREMKPEWELICFVSLILLLISFFSYDICRDKYISFTILAFSLVLLFAVLINKYRYKIKKLGRRISFPWSSFLSKRAIDKLVNDPDNNEKDFKNIRISINLGHEVIKERDILCLIACSINEKYKTFVNSMQYRFVHVYIITAILCLLTCFSFNGIYSSFKNHVFIEYQQTTIERCNDDFDQTIGESSIYQSEINAVDVNIGSTDNWFSRLMANIWKIIKELRLHKNLKYFTKTTLQLAFFALFRFLFKKIELLIPLFSTHLKVKKRLNDLTDRLNSSVDENSGSASNFDKGFINISLFGNRKHKVSQVADIREIETELISIVNLINDDKWLYKVKFYIVFDELDKIDPDITDDKVESITPEYTDSVKGFPAGIETRDRRKNVLKLLANIKLFISTAKAKFVFISGRELYDAYLADLSDRDFAISSIFSGVINVDSFLSPEGGQTDVRSMAELYVANRLIPKQYLLDKEHDYAEKKRVLKKEVPSLRWYYEYLMDVEKKKTGKRTVDIERQKDIEFVVVFLRVFSAYLSHTSNGSPKKIYLYFDKYIKNDIDTYKLNEWKDEIVVGENDDNDKHPVLYFNVTQQNCINFIHYLSGPIMSTITNDLSRFGDRYLVSLSFVIDHIYKHHSRSFSWYDIEQIPELLKTSKAPELRKSVSSIMEFLTQIHISPIVIGFNEYKFHKSIAEEIDYMSKISDEASALFNFTLDESLTVIQHNTMLLNRCIELAKSGKNSDSAGNISEEYKPVIARIHSVLGDLHFGDEDYYKATLEYKVALKFNETKSVGKMDDMELMTKIRTNLKLGIAYEYRKMYPSAYHVYCQLVSYLVQLRNIQEKKFGFELAKENAYDWRYQKYIYVKSNKNNSNSNNIPDNKPNDNFRKQFLYRNLDNDENGNQGVYYYQSIDGVISGFSNDITPEKAKLMSILTLFEEVRYFHQAILAKLFTVEKMVVSGITQTNIDVAESEFGMLYRTTNIEEKFIVAADFFCKLAEILYYKNSLTILNKNQNSLDSALYFVDIDVYSYLESYCYSRRIDNSTNAKDITKDVKFFFENTVVVNKGKHPYIDFKLLPEKKDIKSLFKSLSNELSNYYSKFIDEKLINKQYADTAMKNVKGYLNYCFDEAYHDKKYNKEFGIIINSIETCSNHRALLRKGNNLRPPCYACKYYTRSLKILLENLIVGDTEYLDYPSKSVAILKHTIRRCLRYTRVNQVLALAKALEGMGNTMLSCASFDNYEGDSCKYGKVISKEIIQLFIDLVNCPDETNERRLLDDLDDDIKHMKMTRLDKCLVYYLDAYRYYNIISQHDDAINCLNKIMSVFTYYTGVLNYSKKYYNLPDEYKTVELIVGESYSDVNSLANIIFRLVLRHISFQYDNSGLAEIHEFKTLLSKDDFEIVDLTKLSRYPNARITLLRLCEINIDGRRFLESIDYRKWHNGYVNFIVKTYGIISPSRRYVTTSYEEVIGYYVKTLYNGRIIKELLGGNQLLDENNDYAFDYPLKVYRAMCNYFDNDIKNKQLIQNIFNENLKINDGIDSKIELLEYLIHDSLMCLTAMIRVFTPHNHLTSYTNGFIAMTYNRLWEWSRYYELLYFVYDYKFYTDNDDIEAANEVINNIVNGIKKTTANFNIRKELKEKMDYLCMIIPSEPVVERKFGDRCSILYSRLKHDMDDVSINMIFSNYSAEMAVNYYQMAEETSTEGDAYKDLVVNLYFLNDDLNNDTCQFNIACERFMLNCDVVEKQRKKINKMYKDSNTYKAKSYIDGPVNVWKMTEEQNHNRFQQSEYINSEY